MRPSICGTAVLVVMAGAAKGAVVYDAITTNNWHSSFFVQDEFADDTTLSTGAGTTIRQVEMGVLRNPGFAGTYTGTMTVRLWSDAGGAPGSLLGQVVTPISLADDVPHIIAAEFPDVVATTGTIWTGVLFSYTSQLGAGIVMGTAAPSVGSTTNLTGRHYPDNTWGVAAGDNSTSFIRINTVPGPGAGVVMGVGLCVVARRRRGLGSGIGRTSLRAKCSRSTHFWQR